VCERIVIPNQPEAEQEVSVAHRWWTFSTRFNVAASDRVPAARLHDSESEGVMMKWGLVPASTKASEADRGVPSVDSDAIDGLTYRSIWVYGQRCIVPISGFYVWHRSAAGHRQPFYVRLVNRPVFGVAAVWDRFVTEEDDVIEGCALITVAANSLLAEIDNVAGRMPAILPRDSYDAWLRARPAQAKDLLRAYPADRMLTHAVGPRVNFLKFDDPGLIRPIQA